MAYGVNSLLWAMELYFMGYGVIVLWAVDNSFVGYGVIFFCGL